MNKRVSKTEEIGTLVKKRRAQKKLTQAQLAGVSNTGIRFISDLENGKKTCEIQKVLEVLNMLGIKVNLEMDE